MRTRYVDWLLTAVLIMAAGSAAAQGTADVIDGAKNPDLIPDDQAYHLVLMVASAADDAPEVEEERAKAVVADILRELGPDAEPELAEVANRHRKTLTAYVKEAAAGSSDAERLKAEHLSKVKAEAELRLPAAARKALADYVKAQKKAMRIHGKPDPQVVAMPEPGTGIGTLGYCDGGSGGLAPYCRDGCSGARPCDKRCRRDDESCTTCGNYGVCCCLGGPTPTPTPTPTSPPPPPPSGGMSGEPTGTIYRNVTFGDGGVMYVTAVTDTAASCSCHSSSASVKITPLSGITTSSSSGVVGAMAQATASYRTNVLSTGGEERVRVVSEHTSFCPIRNITFLYAWPKWPDIIISVAITNYSWNGGGNPTEGPICTYMKWCPMGTTSCPADNEVLVDSRLSPCKQYLYDFRLKSKIGDGPWRCWPIGRAVLADNWAPCT